MEPLRQFLQPLALALVVGYFAAAQLQSALLTEFHAAPLAVPLILWALWAVEARRWVHYAIAVVLLASVKEEMALLAALLGLWAVWRGPILSRWGADPVQGIWRITLLGGVLALASLAWFYLATFVIVPAHALKLYGVAESSYFGRYGALGESPLDILRSFFTQPHIVWAVATEPAACGLSARSVNAVWLAGAACARSAAVGRCRFCSLTNSAPIPRNTTANFIISAPVVAYVAAASAFGLVRLWRLVMRVFNQESASFQHVPAASATTMAAMALVRNSAHGAASRGRRVVIGLWIVGWAATSYIYTGAALAADAMTRRPSLRTTGSCRGSLRNCRTRLRSRPRLRSIPMSATGAMFISFRGWASKTRRVKAAEWACST